MNSKVNYVVMRVGILTLVALLTFSISDARQIPAQANGPWVRDETETLRRSYYDGLDTSRKEAVERYNRVRSDYLRFPTRLGLITWGLADLHYGKRHDPDRQGLDPGFDLFDALATHRFRTSVELARILFLIGARHKESLAWEPVGVRLLNLEPEDVPVIYRMARVLNARGTEASFQKAIILEERLIRLAPREANTYLAKAASYYIRSRWTNNRRDLVVAVKNYDLALKYLAYPQTKGREQLKGLVEALRKSLQKSAP